MQQGEMGDVPVKSRFTSFRDVVLETQKKYKGATSLAKTEGADGRISCVYSHVNGIGCAIGCHFTAEKADRLQRDAEDSTIKMLVEKEIDLDIIEEVFDLSKVPVSQLRSLQKAHDSAISVKEFQRRLQRWLDTENFWISISM